jgi:hypothetical protein
MTDLKPFFDRAKADSDDVIRLQNELNTLFNNGTDEGIQAAIDLQPSLDAAVIKAENSNKLYISMRNADHTSSNAASLFVADGGDEQPEEESKEMKFADFQALSPKDRLAFVNAGGTIAA